MYLETYANQLPGIQIMATINLQCNSLSQTLSSVYFMLKTEQQSEHTEGSADTSLAESY